MRREIDYERDGMSADTLLDATAVEDLIEVPRGSIATLRIGGDGETDWPPANVRGAAA
jgi:hypothetical protein